MADMVILQAHTTGLEIEGADRVIAICGLVRCVRPPGDEGINWTGGRYLCNPERDFVDAQNLHGLTPEELAKEQTFAAQVDTIGASIEGKHLVCFSHDFTWRALQAEFRRANAPIPRTAGYTDLRGEFITRERFTAEHVFNYLLGGDIGHLPDVGAHGVNLPAFEQVLQTCPQYMRHVTRAAAMLEAMAIRFEIDLDPQTWLRPADNRFYRGPDDVFIIKIGKHDGKSLLEINADDPGYLQWMQRDMKNLPNVVREQVELIRTGEWQKRVAAAAERAQSVEGNRRVIR